MEADDKLDFSDEGIILVLGSTGAGKSYFLNKLKEDSAKEGHTLSSETSDCAAVQIFLDDDEKRSISVIDTPGFDDTERSAGEILTHISQFLAGQHSLGVPLKGVLYLHRISDNRMTGSSAKYLHILESLIGDEALPNVIFVTTMWNTLRDDAQGTALQREQQLMDEFWAPMITKGAYIVQFDGTPRSAYSLVWQLAGLESVVLNVQREMVDGELSVLETCAGTNLVHQLEADAVAYRQQSWRLKALIEQEEKKRPRNKWELRRLRDNKAGVDKMLDQFRESVDHMRTRPGPGFREAFKELMRTKGAKMAGNAVQILAAILNFTVFVAHMAGT